jgi:hypothetical protein
MKITKKELSILRRAIKVFTYTLHEENDYDHLDYKKALETISNKIYKEYDEAFPLED